jgi:putative oxidoreductase
MTSQSLDGTNRRSSGVLNRLDGFAENHRDSLLLIGRVMIALVFMQSGFGKLMDIPTFAASLGRNGVPAPMFFAYLGGAVEFLTGLTLLLGFATRYTAAMLVLFIIVATLISHRYWEFTDPAQRRPQAINFAKNMAMIGGALFVFVAGAGRASLDYWLRRG